MVEYVSSKNLDKQAILIEREDDNDVVVLVTAKINVFRHLMFATPYYQNSSETP
jgi:hypothetical protein